MNFKSIFEKDFGFCASGSKILVFPIFYKKDQKFPSNEKEKIPYLSKKEVYRYIVMPRLKNDLACECFDYVRLLSPFQRWTSPPFSGGIISLFFVCVGVRGVSLH